MLHARLKHLAGGAAAFALVASAPALAQDFPLELDTEHARISVERVAGGLVHPWALAIMPDGRMLVTERDEGQVRIVTRDGDISEPLAGAPEIFRYEGVTERSQAGLFDVKLHPGFEDNRYVFLSYSAPTERGAALTVTRYTLEEDGDAYRLADAQDVFVMQEDDQDSSGLHFGGRMLIHEGHVYLTIGDRRNISRAQDMEDQAGSIVRVALDGSIPDDNPFVDDDEANDALFSVGHRNIQAITANRETGEIWVVDHGPEGGDEINRVEAGQNYGWPFLTGGVDYSGAPIGVGIEREGMVSPFHVFQGTVAPSGVVVYDGEMFAPWTGDLIVGGLMTRGIVRVRVLEDAVAEERLEFDRRVRDVQIDEEGALWLVTDHEDGDLLRITLVDGPEATGAQ